MCKFCERTGVTVSAISVDKFVETRPVYDGVFGRVQTGTKSTKKQPMITLQTDKGIYCIPMPVKFSYCPHCGRKIGTSK